MKVKISDVLEFNIMCEKIKEQNMPIKTAYKISKVLTQIDHELKFYREELKKILNNYGEKDADGNLVPDTNGSVKIQSDKVSTAQKEFDELLNIEVEVSENWLLTIDELDFLKMTLDEVKKIINFIKG